MVEGVKEITYAIKSGYQPLSMFVCTDIFGHDVEIGGANELYNISKEVYEKISYRSGSDGIIAVFKAEMKTLDSLDFGESPFFIVVESIEKPGNLGAIIRTADGSGADGVIICNERTDIFNPNVIRSSVGTVFSKQVVAASNSEVYNFLEKHGISAYGAMLSEDSESYTKVDFSAPSAVILGTEHEGLSDFWKARVKPIMIPMLGANDSLNVSNAAAVLAYEAVRQRT